MEADAKDLVGNSYEVAGSYGNEHASIFHPQIPAENAGIREISAEQPADEHYVAVIPKEIDNAENQLLEKSVQLYERELPSMLGTKGSFLKKTVKTGKYSTLAFCRGSDVVGAITYQQVPFNPHIVEILLAAVASAYQRQGLGTRMYTKLRKRLCKMGVKHIYVWGDTESERFWSKQGFEVQASTDASGKFLHGFQLKTNLNKAFSHPCTALLMAWKKHGATETSEAPPLEEEPSPSANEAPYEWSERRSPGLVVGTPTLLERRPSNPTNPPYHEAGPSNRDEDQRGDTVVTIDGGETAIPLGERSTNVLPSVQAPQALEGSKSLDGNENTKRCRKPKDPKPSPPFARFLKRPKLGPQGQIERSNDEVLQASRNEAPILQGFPARISRPSPAIMRPTTTSRPVIFICLRDRDQKARIAKRIESLGGKLTENVEECTHYIPSHVHASVVTCTAISAGAWIVSTDWIKETFRLCKFADPADFILKDEQYERSYGIEVQDLVRMARERPRSLFRGYTAYLLSDVHPAVGRLIEFSGGKVVWGVGDGDGADTNTFIITGQPNSIPIPGVFHVSWICHCILKQQVLHTEARGASSLL